MKANIASFDQPSTIYMVFKNKTFIDNGRIFTGSGASPYLRQDAVDTRIRLYALGSLIANNFIFNTFLVLRVILNGANSSIQVNSLEKTAGDAGAADMNGFGLGSTPTPSLFSNIEVKEIILRKAADNEATQTAIYDYLKSANK
jgi:hypothetical protein